MNIDYNDLDQQVYETELKDFLPAKLFDAHAHIFDSSNFPPDYAMAEKCCYQKFGKIFPMESYLAWTKTMLPEQEIFVNSFGAPDTDADRDAAAIYTGKISDSKNHFGMALISPKDSIDTVKQRIEDNNLIGYKPYLNFVDWKAANDVTIDDMLTTEQLEYADQQGLIITLHIPRAERLADPVNQQQMIELCHNYPNVKIIFAHIGRAYFMKNVVGFLDQLAGCSNAWLDTAMVNHSGVLAYTFNNFPRERILFGSDAPIAYLRGKSVEINDQYAYLMAEDYAIGSAIYDADNAVNFTSFFYEQLRGIKQAAELVKLSENEVEDIFFNNAINLFKKR